MKEKMIMPVWGGGNVFAFIPPDSSSASSTPLSQMLLSVGNIDSLIQKQRQALANDSNRAAHVISKFETYSRELDNRLLDARSRCHVMERRLLDMEKDAVMKSILSERGKLQRTQALLALQEEESDSNDNDNDKKMSKMNKMKRLVGKDASNRSDKDEVVVEEQEGEGKGGK